jgi:8-amino-7-oxononanoate synthase
MLPDNGLGPVPADLDRRLADQLHRRSERGQLRSRRVVRILDSTHLELEGRRCVNFAANNYLGLTHHPKLLPLGQSAGSGASGLISGYTEAHASAECRIARWKSTEAAVLLPSGYQANVAAIQTLAALANGDGRSVRFLIDKLAHASLIDGVRASGLPFRVYPHNNIGKLQRLLHDADRSQLQVLVTESIFSMDGDAADLAGIAQLKREYGFAVLLDEAHASGVYGEAGAGLAGEMGLANLADVVVCTFSKAAGGIGAAVCASRLFCEGLINFGRAYIFSTAVPATQAQMAEAAIEIMADEPWRQRRVRSLALEVRKTLASAGVDVPEGDSPIIPIILGNERAAVDAARTLLESGMFVPAIRPPSVSPGASRLRLTISCDHTDGEVGQLIACIKKMIEREPPSGQPSRGP